jgi:hypothetical protein
VNIFKPDKMDEILAILPQNRATLRKKSAMFLPKSSKQWPKILVITLTPGVDFASYFQTYFSDKV